ncbi:MAG: hypothetical protein ACXIVD_06390, partial [Salinarimonas sp.]
SAPCFRMNAFCASENFDAFIVFRSSQPTDITADNSSSEWSSLQGADHDLPVSIPDSPTSSPTPDPAPS